MRTLATYWHTLRYLRPVQLYGRIRYRLSSPRVDVRPAPPTRVPSGGAWVAPARREPSLEGPARFHLLNETRELSEIGWDDPMIEKLWRYNLHYFDDLNAYGAAARAGWHRALLSRWVHDNAPGWGTGWEPYPTSLRIVNWIKWALNGNQLGPDEIQSLAVQVRWLSRRLEHHLLGNHLFANAKALVFAGLFFRDAEADAWLDAGLGILAREIPEQILADGGQFERSTMYHALALEDMEDLVNVTTAFGEAIPPRWGATIAGLGERVGAMCRWLAVMSHPDGEISFFNDAAMGIAPAPVELERYAARLGLATAPRSRQGLTRLPSSGYIRVQRGEMVALLDVAPIGPDYLPGHAHADTLSFELSLFGQRVFVNTGTSRYGGSINRWRERGTTAHNTVAVDGQDSSEVWDSFRVARRARPIGLEVLHGDGVVVRCAHDGYRRLPGKVLHTRQWTFRDTTLIVDDRISGRFGRAEARFHVHPAVQLEEGVRRTDGAVVLVLPGGERVRITVEGGEMRTDQASWHPEFGLTLPTFCVVADASSGVIRTQVQWTDAT